MTDLYKGKDGEQVGLGLLMPETRPTTFARASETLGTMSKSQIIDLINSVNRTEREEWFPPDRFIWHQRHRSSCNGWAASGALTRARVKQGMDYIALSGADLYSRINSGRDQGSHLDAGMREMVANGIAPREMVDDLTYKEREISIEAKRERANYKAGECHRVDDELELAAGLAKGYIGVVAVHYQNNYERLDSNGVIAPCPGPGNHAVGVEAVRYERNRFEFGEFNSHGTRSGNQGRRWLTWRGHLAECNRYHAFYLIRAADGNPDHPDNPFT